MCSGRYAKYVKPKYESDPVFRSRVLARNERYIAKQLAEDPIAYRQRRADASRRCYDAHNEEYREKKRLAAITSRQASLCASAEEALPRSFFRNELNGQ